MKGELEERYYKKWDKIDNYDKSKQDVVTLVTKMAVGTEMQTWREGIWGENLGPWEDWWPKGNEED